jgi:hypothetical protein
MLGIHFWGTQGQRRQKNYRQCWGGIFEMKIFEVSPFCQVKIPSGASRVIQTLDS